LSSSDTAGPTEAISIFAGAHRGRVRAQRRRGGRSVPDSVKAGRSRDGLEIEARQYFHYAFGRRLLRRDLRLETDFAQGPSRLWPAGKFARASEQADEISLYVQPPRGLDQASQPFPGHQHEIVEGVRDRAAGIQTSKGAGSRTSSIVNIGHCRTSAPLFVENPRKLPFLAG
jgi:hypothetical protein